MMTGAKYLYMDDYVTVYKLITTADGRGNQLFYHKYQLVINTLAGK